jgi:DNA-binding CsgD family transcriptional regulator
MMAEPSRGRQRADILAAAVEILLASGDVAAAGTAARELQTIADARHSEWLGAMALSAAGAVQLANGQSGAALAPLRDALTAWRDLDSPYEAARVQVLLGRACAALGDHEGARMEWQAASRGFREFGAAPALAATEALLNGRQLVAQRSSSLTTREVEVLRLLAQGKTNRAIARDLDISEKTVARHVSNIFTKLDLSSRAAATAYAFTHRLAP